MNQLTFDDVIPTAWHLIKGENLICIFTSEERAVNWLAHQKQDGHFEDAVIVGV